MKTALFYFVLALSAFAGSYGYASAEEAKIDSLTIHCIPIKYEEPPAVIKISDSLRTVEVATPINFNSDGICFNYLNKGNGEYIIFQSDRGNSIFVNNINTKETFTIPCPGPIAGVHAIDQDSLYVHIPSLNAVYRYSITSKAPIEILRYSPEILPNGKPFEYIGHGSGALAVSGGKVYVGVIANYKPLTYFNFPTIASYKIEKDTLVTQRFIGYFPEDMRMKFYYLFCSYFCAAGDRVVVSYQGAHDLKVYSNNGLDSALIKAKSAFLRDTFELYNRKSDASSKTDGEMTLEFTQQQYGQMLYNPYLNVFLRVATEKRGAKDVNGKMEYPLKRTVMIFDADLKLIDEIRIDKEGPIMPTPRGFFIYAYFGDPQKIAFVEHEIPRKRS